MKFIRIRPQIGSYYYALYTCNPEFYQIYNKVVKIKIKDSDSRRFNYSKDYPVYAEVVGIKGEGRPRFLGNCSFKYSELLQKIQG